MSTSTPSWMKDSVPSYSIVDDEPGQIVVIFLFCLKWFLRLLSILTLCISPWANYKLIQLFQTRLFHKDSSAKWYIIFIAVLDTILILLSIPALLQYIFNYYIYEKHFLACKLLLYVYYLSDDLVSIILTFLCLDRMIRITCGYHLRKRFSLTVCISSVICFLIINIHHLIRFQYQHGFCDKVDIGILDYDFDMYYSLIYPSVTGIIIFITLIILTVKIFCNRTRRIQLKRQQPEQQKMNKIFSKSGGLIVVDSDRLELIHSTDDFDDPTAVTIEQNNFDNRSSEQDIIDLQITVCVIITSAIFLVCNIPYLIVLALLHFSTWDVFTFINVLPFVSFLPSIAHTTNYFVYNHLAARLFPNNSL